MNQFSQLAVDALAEVDRINAEDEKARRESVNRSQRPEIDDVPGMLQVALVYATLDSAQAMREHTEAVIRLEEQRLSIVRESQERDEERYQHARAFVEGGAGIRARDFRAAVGIADAGVDATNDFELSVVETDEGDRVVPGALVDSLDAPQAVRTAAWLVALADPSLEVFPTVLEAVRSASSDSETAPEPEAA